MSRKALLQTGRYLEAFCLIAAGHKTPTEAGWNAPGNEHDLDTAAAHLQTGGSVGQLCGVQLREGEWLIALDKDTDAQAFERQYPRFSLTHKRYRDNNPDSAVYFYIVDAPIRWQKDHSTGTEILGLSRKGTYSQAVIAGTHPSGARYKLQPAPSGIKRITADELADVWRDLTGRELKIHGETREHAGTPAPIEALDLSDRELLALAMNARNGAEFRSLWNGDISSYPSQSEADLALCGHLAFWTGKDRERIDSLFRQSGLYRDKWERQDYRRHTIDTAIDGTQNTYEPPAPTPERENVTQLIDSALDLVQKYPWPNARTQSTDRKLTLAVLEKMKATGKLELALSVREAAELAGVGKNTAAKGLGTPREKQRTDEHGEPRTDEHGEPVMYLAGGRLVDYGLLQIVDASSDITEATTYTLGNVLLAYALLKADSDLSKVGTHDSNTRVYDTVCTNLLHSLAGDPKLGTPFLHGARIDPAKYRKTPPDESLGPKLLEMIAALVVQNGQTYAELSEATGASRQTLMKKAKVGEALGLFRIDKFNRAHEIRLVDTWRQVIFWIAQRVTTFTRALERVRGHLSERIAHIRSARDKTYLPDRRDRLDRLLERLLERKEQVESALFDWRRQSLKAVAA